MKYYTNPLSPFVQPHPFGEDTEYLPSIERAKENANKLMEERHKKRVEEILKKPKGNKMNVGIKETKEVLNFIVSLANASAKMMDDGKISLMELPMFISPITKLPSALEGLSSVPAEVIDLNEKEKQELITFVQEKLELPADKAEKIVIASFKAALGILEVYQIIKAK